MNTEHIAALVLVTVAAWCDVRRHRIPNLLTYPSWFVGLALGSAYGGLQGAFDSGLGFAAGFVPLFLLFLCGSLGGGDVKLMGGVGALLGFPGGLNALISSILVGGFLAAVVLLWQGRLLALARYAGTLCWSKINRTDAPPPPVQQKDSFPFGLAIAIGTYLTVGSIVAGHATPANLFQPHLYRLG